MNIDYSQGSNSVDGLFRCIFREEYHMILIRISACPKDLDSY